MSTERIATLIDRWRATPGAEVIIDDGRVFLARGRFTDMP